MFGSCIKTSQTSSQLLIIRIWNVLFIYLPGGITGTVNSILYISWKYEKKKKIKY